MKTNPRRIPCSLADVEKARMDGADKGAQLMLDVMIYTLGTDFNLPDSWLERFHDRFMAHLDDFVKGYITQEDMRQTTLQERGWEVQLT